MTSDEAARIVDRLYGHWYQKLTAHAARALGAVDLAENVVQECFMELYRQLLRGEVIAHPEAWTFTVMRREIQRSLRSFTLRERLHDPLDVLDFRPARGLALEPPLEPASFEQLSQRLSQRERETLLLRLEGFKYREIAGTLGITCGSVATLLTRALRKLQLCESATQEPARKLTTLKSDADLPKTVK
jgi:RNA polymerase sigma-70 factor (ECF subfamily)